MGKPVLVRVQSRAILPTIKTVKTIIDPAMSQAPLFQGVSQHVLNELAAMCHEKKIASGETVFSLGDPGAHFYIIKEGALKILKLTREGREFIVELLWPFDFVGLVPVLDGGNCPCTAIAISHTKLLAFPRDPILELLEKHAELSRMMLLNLAKRQRFFCTHVANLPIYSVDARLALYLIEQVAQQKCGQFGLNVSHETLALHLGTVRQVLARSFKNLGEKGLIRQSRRRIQILYLSGLQDLVGSPMLNELCCSGKRDPVNEVLALR